MRYDEFWQRYLRAHARPATRGLHYAGTLLAAACLIGGAGWDWRLLPAAPIIGYGFAWAAHFGIEGNRPETFGRPFWSLASDIRMLALWLAGRLGPHLRDAAVAEADRNPVGGDHPGADQPGTDHPGTDHRGTDHPGTDHRGGGASGRAG